MKVYDLHKAGVNFLGLFIQQNCYAPLIWNEAIQLIEPDTIIEIGTGNGNWTKLLRLMSYEFITEIHTYDIKNIANIPDVTFHNKSIFDADIPELMNGIVIILCDGGNKIDEFNYAAKFLKKGDIIGAHDYYTNEAIWNWSEIKLDDVKEAVNKYNLVSFMQDSFDKAAWLVFKKQ